MLILEIFGKCDMCLLCLKMKNCFENFRCYKLVSEPWFEEFGCTFGCVWTQTGDLRKISKRNDFIKRERVLRGNELEWCVQSARAQTVISQNTLLLCYEIFMKYSVRIA